MRILRMLMLIIILFGGQVIDAESTRIEMKDGSIVSGNVVSLDKGIYTVTTGSMGTIQIPSSQVSSIVNEGVRKPEIGKEADRIYHPKFEGKVKSLQEQLAGDEELMKRMMSLMDDPEYMDILRDPDILDAIRTGDTEKLQANPKVNRLTNNPKLLEIYKRLP